MNNISLREYFDLEDKTEYNFILKYSEPRDVFNIGDFTFLEFGLVKDIQYDVSEDLSWKNFIKHVSKMIKKNKRYVGTLKILDIARFKAYMYAEIERINLVESKLLGYTPDSDELNAGIEEFSEFGSYGQLRTLTGGDVTKNKDVKKMRYWECLQELYYLKKESAYQKRLSDIKYKTN